MTLLKKNIVEEVLEMTLFINFYQLTVRLGIMETTPDRLVSEELDKDYII